MRILLSGASGRVGTNLTKELLARGHQVRGMVYPGDPKADKLNAFDIEIANVGLDDTEGIAKAAAGGGRRGAYGMRDVAAAEPWRSSRITTSTPPAPCACSKRWRSRATSCTALCTSAAIRCTPCRRCSMRRWTSNIHASAD